MDAVLGRLQTLTPDELREEITRAGLKCGPITATTRSIFEKKLARALLEDQLGECSRSEVDGGETGSSSDHAQSPPANSDVLRLDVSPSKHVSDDATQQASPESPSLFYGVLPPLDEPLVSDGFLRVYDDKQKALKAVMTMKGARFKAFYSREDAENFAKGLHDGGATPSKNSADKLHATSTAEKSPNLETAYLEKANEFRSPRIQDLTTKLRRAVEKGDEEAFKELVWGNPRYLIGSGDNPTIVQEGCRYNVLHIAAKENQAGMARLILETLQSPEFMRLMYPDDQEDMLWQRISYILDLYLNTPDKGSNETPLHFACKFGCPEVVNVLCSHPDIDKNCRNKYGQMPFSVICERKNKNKETKEKIQEYLEDRFFVPLLRATDNTLNPVIGAPWAPGTSKYQDVSLIPGLMEDPKNPLMTIRAFVGPLNLSKAEEFHKLWKTPPRDRAKYFHHILKSDPDRGAERVGRELAHEMGYPWAEYWDFLNCFTDLSTEDGLSMLEDYLNKSIQQKNDTEKRCLDLKSPASLTAHKKAPKIDMLLDDHLPSGTSEDRDSWTEENVSASFSNRFPVCDLRNEFERVALDLSSGAEDTADSGLGCLNVSGSDGSDGSSLGAWDWTESEEDNSSSEEYHTADEDTDAVCQTDSSVGPCTPARGILDHTSPWSCEQEDLSSSVSSCSSYKSTHSTPEYPEEFQPHVFLTGESPSKLDSEVLLAVTGIDIDEQRFPCISRWRNTVCSYPESQKHQWPTLVVMNKHTESETSTPRRLTHSWLRGSPSFLSMNKFIPASSVYNGSPKNTPPALKH
ncbi:ankyrin repeat and LEM domain-containing protein 2 isoform X1 [Pangasianodon hypophthalmus]|uniref:ankyrin repeat and LEM domain-containing protein 2 isoform X1 n=1 Tax=Pangasianodon hypophthalmus TaxID=310915 RepID=UPI002307A8F4|nr:ankyrin repeat and LEM domain-containing protein 2 isoform X1 [Pangasianodon hypophthalmus]XP_053097518.1 ankyrin repeat and LEM domain-containing protein 2 isoform X1 [Pangasianodon hypophthalmus]